MTKLLCAKRAGTQGRKRQAAGTAARGGRGSLPPPAGGRRRREEDRFRVPPSLATPKKVFLCCPACGYDPDILPESGVCPKCGGHSWERYTLSRRLLPPEKG